MQHMIFKIFTAFFYSSGGLMWLETQFFLQFLLEYYNQNLYVKIYTYYSYC